ncbi:MAG TPA: LacI family DNA-binding transcriptional regulator [Anaerolineaceae bacterium]|nr:LacI family DNA-binding transcriptional regulator [Anaerolineaceae bacterium]
MAITIKDIAKRAGVSHSTVSRALRVNHLVSSETSKRIREIAQEMGYRPSAVARSLKTKRTEVLGVIVSNISDPFFSEILNGIEASAQAGGYSLFIAASQHDPIKERQIVQTMMEQRTDGVIICSSSFSPEHGRQLLSYGFPVVVVNHQGSESFNYSIYHDDVDGSSQITRHLISLGHKRIAYLGNSQSGRTTQDRLHGFLDVMSEADLEVPDSFIHHVEGGDPILGQKSVEYFMRLTPKPTAIVCFNDMLAIGVLKGCEVAGFRVPEDLSVTGFDNITYSAFTTPCLTTFDQPKFSIGQEAAQLLLDLLRAEDGIIKDTPNVKILKGKLLIRGTTSTPGEAY